MSLKKKFQNMARKKFNKNKIKIFKKKINKNIFLKILMEMELK